MTAALEANPRKQKPTKTAQRKENPFIRYELTKEETQALRAARVLNPDVWNEMGKLIEEGYKLTLTWDDYSNSPACWLFAKNERDPNFGAILSGRGRTIENAVFEVIYKHYVVFQRVWPRSQNKADDAFWDD
jgi:ornithine carbamoyltransferase